MRRFAMICKIEWRLFTRDFFSVFFALVFPILMLLLFGSIFGNKPLYEGSEMTMMGVSVPAYCVMVTGVKSINDLMQRRSGKRASC